MVPLQGTNSVKYRSDVLGRAPRLATSIITVHDTTDSLVAGATVTGTWDGTAGATGVVSGITGTDGTVTLSTGNLTAEAGTTVTFAVDGLAYVATDDHDPDTDDHETSITVTKS